MKSLNRLFRPKTIAVVGGGAWCRLVIEQCQKMGFDGEIWPVHPKEEELAGLPVYRDVASLPEAPDATFVGVNRFATIEVVRDLAARDAGGAVCFASGFLEAQAEDAEGADLQAQLLQAAGEMPFLGPNCYGFVNAFEQLLEESNGDWTVFYAKVKALKELDIKERRNRLKALNEDSKL